MTVFHRLIYIPPIVFDLLFFCWHFLLLLVAADDYQVFSLSLDLGNRAASSRAQGRKAAGVAATQRRTAWAKRKKENQAACQRSRKTVRRLAHACKASWLACS
ncbi:hypothetical protein GUJ93_ZPchr0012g21201 [Zizania palustris]|uniref:Uncharacterized protein n=1 Tax=Zizania palustris TaxID=103762 RepID=A0A8J5WUB1_ZIZPA|nr:hypothetical protein GUJ93_ZPchr0012g21201 [Zizania palustris]